MTVEHEGRHVGREDGLQVLDVVGVAFVFGQRVFRRAAVTVESGVDIPCVVPARPAVGEGGVVFVGFAKNFQQPGHVFDRESAVAGDGVAHPKVALGADGHLHGNHGQVELAAVDRPIGAGGVEFGRIVPKFDVQADAAGRGRFLENLGGFGLARGVGRPVAEH